MSPNLLVYGLAVLGIAAHLAIRRAIKHWERGRLGQFASMLDPRERHWLDALRRDVETHGLLVERHVESARNAWAEEPERALHRLRLACEALEQVVQPSLARTIAELRSVARTVAVLAPPRPLAVAAYKLWQVRGLHGVISLAHWVLVTGRERARLRVWFFGRALVSIVKAFTGAVVLQAHRERWYMTTVDAAADLRTMQADLVTTAESILDALAAWRNARQRATTPPGL
jgi:hypothetical protein